MKCILCGKRKGKRFCPAKNTLICAQCCGEKRVVEIACPADCVYLKSGQSYQTVKKYVAQMDQEEDPIRRRKLLETNQRFSALLFEIEQVVIHFTQGLHAFQDKSILEAVRLLEETYKTEEKGLIYEHQSADPLAQALFTDLRELLEGKRVKVNEQAPLLRRTDILDCLQAVQSDILYHYQNQSDRGSYLQFIRRNHPQVSSKPSTEGLIYPG